MRSRKSRVAVAFQADTAGRSVYLSSRLEGGGGGLVWNSWWLNKEEFGVVMRKRRQVRDAKQTPGQSDPQ